MNTTPQFHALRVHAVQPEADDALLVSFDVPPALAGRFRFSAGQYLTLRRGDLRRAYSICAGPGEALRVGVRRVGGGAFSNWLHGSLRAGDTLDVMEPQGSFGAALSQRPRHVLAVAGGSGITPTLAIVKAVLAGDAAGRCTLLYGNRSSASTMFKDEIDDLKNSHFTRLAVHPVFSREAVDSALHSGRPDAAKVATVLRLCGRVDAAFICGPHTMNDAVEAALLAAGLAPAQIHVERFGVPAAADTAASAPQAPQVPQPGGAGVARIAIVRDGVTREIGFAASDGTILGAAQRAGFDLPYSCKSGVCATCRARLLHGRVHMERSFALEPEDIAAGFVLTCQARPLTPSVVVSFDAR